MMLRDMSHTKLFIRMEVQHLKQNCFIEELDDHASITMIGCFLQYIGMGFRFFYNLLPCSRCCLGNVSSTLSCAIV